MLPYYTTYDLLILRFEFRALQTLKQQNAHLPKCHHYLYHNIPFFPTGRTSPNNCTLQLLTTEISHLCYLTHG